MASFLRNAATAAAPRVEWTPEEAGRFAAARDVAMLREFAKDRKLLAAARRLQFAWPATAGLAQHQTVDVEDPVEGG